MSALPHFVQDQRDNVVWKDLIFNQRTWLERKIRSLLKSESKATRYVYGYLRYVDKDNRGFAYPAQATIARAVKCSPRHVIRCLARLEEISLIYRGKREGHSYYIFTLPSSLEGSKSPFQENIDFISEQAKTMGKKALINNQGKDMSHQNVTKKCHTSKNLNKYKINKPAPQPKEKPKKVDWFSWIEDNKTLELTKTEREQVNTKAQEILESRQNRFKDFPQTFLSSYVREIALAFVLKQRGIEYSGSDCLMRKELNLS